MITERNYLEVYPYEKWNDKVTHSVQCGYLLFCYLIIGAVNSFSLSQEIPVFEEGETFQPESILVRCVSFVVVVVCFIVLMCDVCVCVNK